MSSIFEKPSTRIFCIAGVLNDIYAMPDLRLLTFEEYLNERLHRMGYQQVVFFSGAKQMFFALDSAGCEGLDALKNSFRNRPKPRTQLADEKAPSAAAQPAPARKAVNIGIQRQRPQVSQPVQTGSAESAAQPEKHYVQPIDTHGGEARAMKQMNMLMHDSSVRRALVFTSLDDFLRNTEDAARRSAFAFFEDWKSLPTENDNICIFLSKSIDMSHLQELFRTSGAFSLQSLFFRQGTGGAAEFNHNSSMIVGPPLNDEIGNLLQYLRIFGHSFTRRNADMEDVTVTAHLRWNPEELVTIQRSLSYYSRSSEFVELKGIKETLEGFIEERGTEDVLITPADIAPLYPLSTQPFRDEKDPLAMLGSRRGWEPAYAVLNSYITNVRSMYPAGTAKKPEGGLKVPDIERMEPGRAVQQSAVKVPNFVLQGNPGVGKTEIAGLIGQILQQEGILKSGHTVTASRDKLIGQYVGWTAVQTAALIEQAQEGVLLVDEVYSLAEGGDSNTASFCKEAFDTLVAAMTNKNNRFCVIFAGYENRMHEVWEMNEGLFSRFGESNVITIPEYQPDLLQSIFEHCIAKKDGDGGWEFVLSEDVRAALPEFFKNLYGDRDKRTFGNARDMNNLAASVRRAACYRHIVALQEHGLSAAEHRTVTVERADFGEEKAKMFEKRGFTTDDIYAKIYEYVGLDFLVDMFNDQLAIKVEYEEKGLDYPGPAHMIWLGNPGTGKSTAAQLTAQLYHTLGMLGSDKPIYVDASTLTSSYVAGSAKIINEKMDEACSRHAILVIDEAYQLINNAHGKEVIDAMLNRMETDRKSFNVIFIVYTNLREAFLSANPGLESRLKCYEFKDYNAEQLFAIFRNMYEKTNDRTDSGCEEAVRALLASMYAKGLTRDGNARIVRQLLEEMRQRRYQRVLSRMAAELPGGDTPKNRSSIAAARALGRLSVPSDAYIFTAADVPQDFAERRAKKA
jgi:replication-associated recombination protein RarA